MYRSPRLLILLAVFAMIAGLTSGAATAADSFTDDDGSTFEADIEWMAAEGITRGCNPPANDPVLPRFGGDSWPDGRVPGSGLWA